MNENTRIQAERLLTDLWGTTVRLHDGTRLHGSHRSQVYRWTVQTTSTHQPTSVIIKQPVPPHGTVELLLNDWAGLQFLSQLPEAQSLAPQLYVGNRESGLVVLEDLGKVTQLNDLLLSGNREDATNGLVALAATLGRMHAASIGHQESFDHFRNSLGERQTNATKEEAIQHLKHVLWQWTSAARVIPASGIDADFEALEKFMDERTLFMAYTHNDPCPDNCLIVDGEAKLIDFESGSYRHALLDGVYGRIHFPTCWCVNQIPSKVYEMMEEAYRLELAKKCDAANDIELFKRAVTEACAWQVVWSLDHHLLTGDIPCKISSKRQRVVVRLDKFAEISDETNHLKVMGAAAREMAASLRAQWRMEDNEMPVYPAFRSG